MSSSSCRREQPWSLQYCGSSGLMQGASWPARSYPCGFCKREFRSAQALGGHMNVHRRDRAKLRLRHDASPPPAHLPPTKVQPPAPPLLPNLNYPPPHDYCHYQCQSPGAGGGDSSSSSPPAAVNLELGRPPADGATEEDDGLDLELRLASC